MKHLLYILLISSLPISLFAQVTVILGTDTSQYKSIDEYEENNTIKDGYWIEYFTKNKLKEEGLYKNDKKEGRWISYYINGNKKQIVSYKNGIANGRIRMFYENGNPSEEGTWNGVEGYWTGEYKFYYQNGNPSYIWKYDNNGKRTGTQRYFHENGNISIEGEWQDGAESGLIKHYYENGSLKSEENFENGKRDESSIVTYEKKEIESKDNGPRKFTGNGYYKSTNTQGQVVYEGIWKEGNFFEGNRYVYDESGNITKILVYRNGTKIGEKSAE